MQPKNLPVPGNSEKHGEDRATAAILASGGAGSVSAFALRHWRPDGNPTEPVFITWLLGIGRFCLTVKYGRYSLKGADWYLDSGSGPRATPSPLDPGPARGAAVDRGLAAAAEPAGARVAGPGLLRHGAQPAPRAPRPPERCSPALGPGGLHRQAG